MKMSQIYNLLTSVPDYKNKFNGKKLTHIAIYLDIDYVKHDIITLEELLISHRVMYVPDDYSFIEYFEKHFAHECLEWFEITTQQYRYLCKKYGIKPSTKNRIRVHGGRYNNPEFKNFVTTHTMTEIIEKYGFTKQYLYQLCSRLKIKPLRIKIADLIETEEFKNDLKTMYIDEICEKHGYSYSYLTTNCARNGLTWKVKPRYYRIFEDVDKVVEYLKSHTIEEAASEFGVSNTTIIRLIRRMNIKRPDFRYAALIQN